MEKNKPRRLVFWFCVFFVFVFFFPFISHYSCFGLNITNGKWNLLIWQWFQWHLGNHLFPPLLHLFPTGVPWGSHRPLKPPWVYCFPTVVPGSSCSWQERRAPLAVGRNWRNFSRMWDRWKDKHPWNTRRLETFIYACVYVSVVQVVMCICLWTIYMVQVVVMCVSAHPYVYNNRDYIVEKQRCCLRLKHSPCWFLSWQFEWGAEEEFSL